MRWDKPEAGLEFVETAMRLNPSYPSHYVLARGMALFATGALDEAARVFAKAIEADPHATELAPPLAATYVQLGRRREARELLLMWKPGASQRELDDTPFVYHFPYKWSPSAAKIGERLIDGLVIAALPVDVTIADLVSALGQGNLFERARAARTLGRFGSQAAESVPALVSALADERHGVRREAIIALRKIGPTARAALPALAAVQDDDLIGSMARDAVKDLENK